MQAPPSLSSRVLRAQAPTETLRASETLEALRPGNGFASVGWLNDEARQPAYAGKGCRRSMGMAEAWRMQLR